MENQNTKERTIVIKTYENLADAHFDLEALRSQNIVCSLNSTNMVQLFPMFNSPFGKIQLIILESDVDLVNKLLSELHQTNNDNNE